MQPKNNNRMQSLSDGESEDFEEPVDVSADYGQKPHPSSKQFTLKQEPNQRAGEVLFSPKFGGAADENSRIASLSGQHKPAGPISIGGVLGNLLQGNPNSKKRTKTAAQKIKQAQKDKSNSSQNEGGAASSSAFGGFFQ